MKIRVEKIDGEILIAELPNRLLEDLPKIFAPDAKEGDIIEIKILKEETENEKKRIETKMNDLFES